jgi:hypothetical protein
LSDKPLTSKGKPYPFSTYIIKDVSMKMDWSKFSLLITAAVILLMLAFPPFVIHGRSGMQLNAGYSFILAPPDEIAVINNWVLMVQCLIAAMVGVLAHFGLKK